MKWNTLNLRKLFTMKTSSLFFLSLIALCFSITFTSCTSITGTGAIVTESRALAEITGIELGMDAEVYLIKGDTQSVVISAQQNILAVLTTELSGTNLEIKTSESISVTQPIQIWITVKTINEIELNGSGNITSNTVFNSEKISADVSGSGTISLVLNTENFNGEISGSGDIKLKGKSANGKFSISGSGNVYATECEIDQCKIEINGSGAAKLNVLTELDANIDGSGEVLYTGNPQKVKSDSNGSGRISKIE